jgi:hypothetical protein
MRERMVQLFALNSTEFRVENYLGGLLGERLEEFVELAPCTWLPLIPALSQGRSIDMSRDVVSASSWNAYESCGYFVSTPDFVITSTALALLGAAWGIWNYWKMKEIKRMVLPGVKVLAVDVDDESSELVEEDGSSRREVAWRSATAIVTDPPYLDPVQFAHFDSSPGLFGIVESFLATSSHPENDVSLERSAPSSEEERSSRHRRLFGKATKEGPEMYLHSIKFQAWLTTTQLVFWGGQIVVRDLSALPTVLQSAAASSAPSSAAIEQGGDSATLAAAAAALEGIGRPDLVVPEFALYGTFVLMALAQLLVLVPSAFVNYNIITSVEEMADIKRLRESCGCAGILEGRQDG